jgi:hypothetical protein
MAEDAKRMFGGSWEPGDFEPSQAKVKLLPSMKRIKCGKKFKKHSAVSDHMRDKHMISTSAPE